MRWLPFKKREEAPFGPSRSSSLDLFAASFGETTQWTRTTEVRDAREVVILRLVLPNGDSFSASGLTTKEAETALRARAAQWVKP